MKSCVIEQRVEHAHHLWSEGVINGHTPEGFRQAWLAQFAHEVLHVQRRLGTTTLTDRAGLLIDKKDEQFLPELRAGFEYPVPGVVEGVCHLDEQ